MEFFAKTNHKLDSKKTKLTATGFLRGSSFRQNGFGNIPIKSTNKESHIWKFKISRNKHEYGITLGIIEDGHLDLDGKFTSKGFGYGLNSDGDIYSAHSTEEYYKLKNGKQQFKTGDIVIMRLDLIKKCLSFSINDINDKLIKIKKIKYNKKIAYKMAVYLYYEGDSVELIDYFKEKQKEKIKEKKEKKEINEDRRLKRALTDIHQIQHHQIDEKQDENKIIDLKKENDEYKKTLSMKVDVINLLQTEITEKNMEIKTLKQKLEEIEKESDDYLVNKKMLQQKLDEITQQESRQQNKILMLQKENEILRNDRDETQKINLNQQTQIESLQNENNQLKRETDEYKIKIKELDKLKMQNGILMEEQKELEIENKKLKKENKELKLQNLDSSKYENWSWEEIIEWILSIEDGRFMKYDKNLRDILSEEEPIGEDLQEVNEVDIKRWGIKNFRDIKALYQHIKELVNNDDDDNNDNDKNDNNDKNETKGKTIAVANSEGHETGGHYR